MCLIYTFQVLIISDRGHNYDHIYLVMSLINVIYVTKLEVQGLKTLKIDLL